MKMNKSLFSVPFSMLINLALVYIVYEICRFAFLFENWTVFAENLTWSSLGEMLRGGWMFDTSAILYTNALYILLMLFPVHYKETFFYQTITKWIFIVVNSICAVVMNIVDSVYFQYTGRRTTFTVFHEFSNEANLGSIVGVEFLRHWYLVLLAILLVWGLCKFYVFPKGNTKIRPFWKYYLVHALCLAAFAPLCICGMRGGATTAVRPITISNANQYVNRPTEAALVLNTPFSLIRTIDKKAFINPEYMSDAEMNRLYSPLHQPSDSAVFRKKNVVVLIVESFGREYIGGFNHDLEGGKYTGYTPFVDSLMQHSATYAYSFCNGRKSIDGMPSILSSIPMFVEPFFLTPASLNDVSGLAGELTHKKGYYSAFFHGAENGSMGFQAFARATGFTDYYGRTEYSKDPHHDGDLDFDGTWAIWDEPFLQFYCEKMNTFRQPFMTAVFTASSHHPYVIPEKYKTIYPEEGIIIHKCIRYTDHALKRFFESASKQPWYKNTLFVLTSDHTNMSDHPEYQTDLGFFSSPIIFFDPSGDFQAGRRDAIAQQIDIMPTVMSYLGYNEPYFAFGCDLLTTPAADTWAVNYLNGVYQYVKGDYMIQFDGQRTKGIYRFKTDRLMQHNLVGTVPEQVKLEKELKALIQSYMQRMNGNQLISR